MKTSVHTPAERAYCPVCGEDLGPAQDDGKELWCRNHAWVIPVREEEIADGH